jgi:hypothetical protein
MLSTKFLAAAFSASALLAQEQPRPNFQYAPANPQKQDKPASTPPSQVKPPAKPQETSPALPSVMHFCGQNCITLQLDNGRYESTTDMPGVPRGGSVWTVGSFTRDSVILHRVDSSQGRPIFQGTYSGKISPEGNSIVNVAADGQPSNGRLKITWDAALNSIPGSNEELAIRSRQPASCNPSQPISPDKAEDLGLLAFSDKNPDVGICWFRMAAAQGEPNAQGVLAVILYKGMYNARIDIPEAVSWAQKGAKADNYIAEKCLAQMYDRGDGIPKDSEEALYWRVKATTDEQVEKLRQQQAEEAQQARQAQAQLQQQQAGPLSLLELLLGAFAGGTSGPPDHSVYIDPNRVRREACASGGTCH